MENIRNVNSGDSLEDIKIGDKMTFIGKTHQMFTCVALEDKYGKIVLNLSAACETCSELFNSTMGRTATYPVRKCLLHRKKTGEQKTVTDIEGESDFKRDIRTGKTKVYQTTKEGVIISSLGKTNGKPITQEVLERYKAMDDRFYRKYGMSDAWTNATADYEGKHGLIVVSNPDVIISLKKFPDKDSDIDSIIG